MEKFSFGVKRFDNLLGDDIFCGMTCVYGAAATGKTTLAIMAAVNMAVKGKKVLFIDTEIGFSVERLKQISDSDAVFNNIFVQSAKDMREQASTLEILNQRNPFALIIIDTIGRHFRHEKNIYDLKDQLNLLKRLSYSPILITNQVYSSDTIKPVGGKFILDRCDHVIKLSHNNEIRKADLVKPVRKSIEFTILKKGLF